MKNIKELREQRFEIVKNAQELLKKDDFSKEDESKFDQMMEDSDRILARVERMEKAHDAEESLNERVEVKAGRENISADQAHHEIQVDGKARMKAFDTWCRFGMGALTSDDRSIMASLRQEVPNIQAAQSVGTTTAGGFTVPDEAMRAIDDAMLAFGGMRQASQVFSTSSGADLPIPTSNDTAQVGELLAENTQAASQDITFGQLVLQSYMYSSKVVLVSQQLLQDSSVNLNPFIFTTLGTRIGRITNTHFTTGTGSGQPNGVVTASTQGVVGTTGQTTTVIYADLVDLEHSVDPSYRNGARWMMADGSLKVIKKLVDGQSRPLWSAGLAVKEPDTILSYPYTINQDVPAMAANAKSILFGDFSKYLIRDTGSTTLLRLVERYADYLQVGFLAFSRHDGDLLNAGTNPIKHYANSAT